MTLPHNFKFVLNQEYFDYRISDTVFQAELINDHYKVDWIFHGEPRTVEYDIETVKEAFDFKAWRIKVE